MAAVYQAMLPKTLPDLPGGGLRGGSIVSVADDLQHFSVDLHLLHKDQADIDENKHPDKYILEGAIPEGQPNGSSNNGEGDGSATGTNGALL